jgi:hypothetical protein
MRAAIAARRCILCATGAMAKEQRKAKRQRPDLHVWIETKEGALVKSTLLDISDGGARLAAEDVPELKGQFVLRLTEDGRVSRKCQIVWRSEDVVGLQFVAKRVAVRRRNADEKPN